LPLDLARILLPFPPVGFCCLEITVLWHSQTSEQCKWLLTSVAANDAVALVGEL
jgi:hypothetical protein